jgi:hypothetical protein
MHVIAGNSEETIIVATTSVCSFAAGMILLSIIGITSFLIMKED